MSVSLQMNQIIPIGHRGASVIESAQETGFEISISFILFYFFQWMNEFYSHDN